MRNSIVIFLTALFAVFGVHAASPSFQQFDPNEFQSNSVGLHIHPNITNAWTAAAAAAAANAVATNKAPQVSPGVTNAFSSSAQVVLLQSNGASAAYQATNDIDRWVALRTAVSNAVSGDIVQLGKGEFKATNAPINVPPGVKIVGKGDATHIFCTVGNADLFKITGYGTAFDSLFVERTNGTGSAFYFLNTTNASLTRVRAYGPYDITFNEGTMENELIDSCYFYAAYDIFNTTLVTNSVSLSSAPYARDGYNLIVRSSVLISSNYAGVANSQALFVPGIRSYVYDSFLMVTNNGVNDACVRLVTSDTVLGGYLQNAECRLVGCTLSASPNGSVINNWQPDVTVEGRVYRGRPGGRVILSGCQILSGTNAGPVIFDSPLNTTNGFSLVPINNWTNIYFSGWNPSTIDGKYIVKSGNPTAFTNGVCVWTNVSQPASGLNLNNADDLVNYESEMPFWNITNAASSIGLFHTPVSGSSSGVNTNFYNLGDWQPQDGVTAGTTTIGTNGFTTNYFTGLPTNNASVYAAGTAYSLTPTNSLLDFGTTDPSVTIPVPGTYKISAGANLKYSGTTFAGTQTATIKLRRTNNTAGDLTGATRTVTLRIVTNITDDAGAVPIPDVIYTTSNYNDTIEMFGVVSAIPAAGSVDADSAEIIITRLY